MPNSTITLLLIIVNILSLLWVVGLTRRVDNLVNAAERDRRILYGKIKATDSVITRILAQLRRSPNADNAEISDMISEFYKTKTVIGPTVIASEGE